MRVVANVLRVDWDTSPHLLKYNERVRVDRIPVDDVGLCQAFARVEAARQAAGDVALTYFEFGTLAAIEVFRVREVEVMILEVGLGGRLDAVNAYDPDCAVVTSVALDHTDWLGSTREAIGFEKAGIFRASRPAVCADPEPPQSLLSHAQAIGADLYLLGRDFGHFGERLQWTFWRNGGRRRSGLANPGLRGACQLRNASAALFVVDVLGQRLPVSMQAFRSGLIEPDLPGRFQVLPGRPALVLDVAHNPQAVGVLADNLCDMAFSSRTIAVVGMLADKDIAGSLAPLAGKVDTWLVYDSGLGELTGESVFVPFSATYVDMLGDKPVVTITPIGAPAQLYLKSVSVDGFTVVATSPQSGLSFNWIAVGNRVDATATRSIPKEVSQASFDTQLRSFMGNDADTRSVATPMWWDGQQLRFDAPPSKPRVETALPR